MLGARKNKRVRQIVALLLALAMGVLLIGCANGASSAITEDSANAKDKGGTTTGSSNESTTGESTEAPDDPEDVACIPKEAANKASDEGQPNGGPPPDELPPPPEAPKLSDPVPPIVEEEEEGEEGGPATRDQNAPLIEDGMSNADSLQEIKEKEEANGASQEKLDRLDEVANMDTVPTCKDTWKGADPGHGGDEADKGKDNHSVSAFLGNLVSPIAEFVGLKEASAQTSCQPVAIVRYNTGVPASEAQSAARAVDKQLWTEFSSDWWCAYAYYADNASQIGSGSWPIYLSYTSPQASGIAYHYYGAQPTNLSLYTPYGFVPDVNYLWQNGSCCYWDSWSTAISHEAVEMMSNPYMAWNSVAPGNYAGYPDTTQIYVDWESADEVYNTGGYYLTSYYDNRSWKMSDYVLRNYYRVNSFPPWDQFDQDKGGAPQVQGGFYTYGCGVGFIWYRYGSATATPGPYPAC